MNDLIGLAAWGLLAAMYALSVWWLKEQHRFGLPAAAGRAGGVVFHIADARRARNRAGVRR